MKESEIRDLLVNQLDVIESGLTLIKKEKISSKLSKHKKLR